MTIDPGSLRKIIRNGVLALLALLAIAVLVRFQVQQAPLYESARAYVESMERAFRSVETGTAEFEDFTDSVYGFTGFELAGPQLEGFVGEYAERCYVVWQRGQVSAGAGLLSPALPCVADPQLEFSQSYEAQIVVVRSDRVEGVPIEWDPLLPPSRTPAWFVLVISLLVWLAFNSFVSITLIMYRRRRKT